MKLLLCALPMLLIACGSTKYSVTSGSRATDSECCGTDCDVDARCLPNGNCLITCTDASGSTCEVELSCANGQCSVVRSDCPPDSCCAPTKAD